jgi:Mg2+ and Co2+ transporter CorA
MNFASIPLTHHPLGFYWALGIMALAALALWLFLRRQQWT